MTTPRKKRYEAQLITKVQSVDVLGRFYVCISCVCKRALHKRIRFQRFTNKLAFAVNMIPITIIIIWDLALESALSWFLFQKRYLGPAPYQN